MTDYLNLLALIAPVFLVISVGMFARRVGILSRTAEDGLVGLVLKILYPCLVVNAMIRADSFRNSPDILIAPLAGFATTGLGFLAGYWFGRAFGMTRGAGLRTFAFAVGICNYGYIPIPLVQGMFGSNELAVLFMHNVGVEVAIWTIGVAMLAGASIRDGIKRVANPMVFALAIGILLNLTGLSESLPGFLSGALSMLSATAVPLGLLAIGSSLDEFLDTKESLYSVRHSFGGMVVRLAVLPLLGLGVAWLAPVSLELKRILIIQAAMPAGIMPIVLAKHYGGQSVVALRVVLASTALGLFSMPFWIRFGLGLIG